MIELVEPSDGGITLRDYEEIPHLAPAVHELRAEASALIPRFAGRRVWMVNSTARGGGVAEMLPKMALLLEELGVPTRWAVIGTDREAFFELTKRLHNLIHGEGDPELTPADQELYEAVSRENADDFERHLRPDDILIVHDPQPLGMGALLKKRHGHLAIWRCHIGLDERLPATTAAWRFLRDHAEPYDHAVFSAPEYIPDFLAGRATIIHPAIDPCSHKNRDLSPHKLTGILCNAGLVRETQPVVTPPFEEQAKRLRPDGEFGPANDGGEIGLMHRPIITQISRWDRLKGYAPLLEGFVRLKGRLGDGNHRGSRHRRRLEIVRLILAGPDPASVQDDPEGREVLDELIGRYRELDPEQQRDVAVLSLPMGSRKFNALMVNALQRCSTVIVQNSIREGFGLTATEAMWKRVPTVGTHACGLRQQIRDGIDGVLIRDPEDGDEIAAKIDTLLSDVPTREAVAGSGQRRVHQEFLIFTQLRHWLRLLAECAEFAGAAR